MHVSFKGAMKCVRDFRRGVFLKCCLVRNVLSVGDFVSFGKAKCCFNRGCEPVGHAYSKSHRLSNHFTFTCKFDFMLFNVAVCKNKCAFSGL